MSPPTATIRNEVSVPLRFADGYTTAARVFSFDGLADGRENLAFGLGDWAAALASGSAAQRPDDFALFDHRHNGDDKLAASSPAPLPVKLDPPEARRW